jgi:hypothetical protein
MCAYLRTAKAVRFFLRGAFGSAQGLWRGSLLPLGCAATLKPFSSVLQPDRIGLVYGCFAAEREQAPSPQKKRRTQLNIE